MRKRIMSGYGYWETTYYPIGGCFRRAGKDGREVVSVQPLDRFTKGCNVSVKFTDGTTGACDSSNIEEYEEIVQSR